jgi:Tol biopolymer transport system component
MKRRPALVAVLAPSALLALIVALAVTAPVDRTRAAFPGDNGPIAFVRTGDDLYLMQGNGTHKRRVYHDRRDAVNAPAFSPNGRRIAFVRHAVLLGTDRIVVMRRDGTHLRRLTHKPLQAVEPGFSPSGRRIVFAAA